MRVSGPLGDVNDVGYSGYQVTFAYRPWARYGVIFMYFNSEWGDQLKVVPRRKRIDVLGQIKSVESIEVHLENCGLMDVR